MDARMEALTVALHGLLEPLFPEIAVALAFRSAVPARLILLYDGLPIAVVDSADGTLSLTLWPDGAPRPDTDDVEAVMHALVGVAERAAGRPARRWVPSFSAGPDPGEEPAVVTAERADELDRLAAMIPRADVVKPWWVPLCDTLVLIAVALVLYALLVMLCPDGDASVWGWWSP